MQAYDNLDTGDCVFTEAAPVHVYLVVEMCDDDSGHYKVVQAFSAPDAALSFRMQLKARNKCGAYSTVSCEVM